MSKDTYQSPLAERYASHSMQHIFSPNFKYSTWRRLWVALAQAQLTLGLPVTQEQIAEMSAHIEDIDFAAVAKYEKLLKHDVMAHIYAYGDQCPLARPIIHLGATSCYVTDNTDIIQIRDGLQILIIKIVQVIRQLSDFSRKYADLACLGFTHFQPAQLTTVGKRACLWTQEFLMDLQELELRSDNLRFLGVKGTTGTQASFFALFGKDHDKVQALDHLVAAKMGFSHLFIIAGQTYSRKQDVVLLNALAGIAISAHKFSTDMRLLAHLKEIEEPFAKEQVGSSAMPYKRNPILSERICSLSRFLISLTENPAYNAATQWFERTLDDSANRRLCIPEAFLTCDAILELLLSVTSGMVVYDKMISKRVKEELPFMATENILMACVKKGGDRQDLHEKIRVHSQAACQRVKVEACHNDLLERIAQDPSFHLTKGELDRILNVVDFVGRAPQQVTEFLEKEVDPVLAKYRNLNLG
jgi:adenylosuccinate lyase